MLENDLNCDILTNSTISQAAVTPENVTSPEECASALPTSTFDVRLEFGISNPVVTLHAGDELCAIQLGNTVVVDITANPHITTNAQIDQAVIIDNKPTCLSVREVRAIVTSGTPPNPLVLGSFVCVGLVL